MAVSLKKDNYAELLLLVTIQTQVGEDEVLSI